MEQQTSFQSENIAKLAAALSAAQGELEAAPKDSMGNNSHKYASLTAVLQAVQKVLPKHGLAVSQIMMPTDGKAHIRTILLHESGEWIAGECVMAPDRQGGPQGMGSAITYARRYSLSAIIGVASEEDDDGEAAQPKKGNGRAPKELDNGPTDNQLKALFATVGETLPYMKGDKAEIRKLCGLIIGREISSSKEMTSGEVSSLISNPKLLLEYAPTQAEYESMKARAPIAETTLKAIEAELTRLGVAANLLPPGFEAYGAADPAELTEVNGKIVLNELKKMKV